MSAETSFDLILMDIKMPEQDGVAATKEIRRREESTGAEIPIIAMTAHDQAEELKSYRNEGMQGYIAKPVTIEKLESVLSRLSVN